MSGGCDAGSSGPSGGYAGPGHASRACPVVPTTAGCRGTSGDGTDNDGWSASSDSKIQDYKDSLQGSQEASRPDRVPTSPGDLPTSPGDLPTSPGRLSAGSGDVSAGDLLSGAGDLSAGLHSASLLPDSQLPLVGCPRGRLLYLSSL